MSNKYLEKVASYFVSTDYKKTLSKDEKRDYNNEYNYPSSMTLGRAGKMLLGAGILAGGVTLGHSAGSILSKKPAQAAARKVWKRNILKGVDSDTATAKGIAAHLGVRAAGTLGGTIAGAGLGSKYLDKVKHEHAKSVVENRRKQND